MPRRLAVHLFLCLVAYGVRPAAAQLYGVWHRPIDVSYRYAKTNPFPIIYQRGTWDESRELADILERELPEVRARIGLYRDLNVPLVVNRFTDRSNGFVTPLPFRQEVQAVPIRGHSLSPRFAGWLETVGPHELVHAAHAESGRGFGVGWMLRGLGPDLARALNLSAPRGINEGLAVWMESRVRPGAGRLNHSLFRMQFRAAMASDDPWSLTQMLEPPAYTRPFDRHYIGGAFVFEHLARDEDVAFFRRARDFYYRFPLLGFGPALWFGTRSAPHVLGRRMRRHFRQAAIAHRAALGTTTDVEVVASERGTVHRRPTWLDDETLLTYAHGYHLRPGFYRVNVATGEKRLVAATSITEDFQYSLDADRSNVLFSRYRVDTIEPIRAVADAYRLHGDDGRIERVTHRARTFAPVAARGSTTWALQNVGPQNRWVEVTEEGEIVPVGMFPDTAILQIAPSPDGAEVVVLANRSGDQVLFRAVREGTAGMQLEPWVGFPDGSVYDARWSDRGAYLLFSADPGGVTNVFVWRRADDRIFQLTNVVYGALEPALSPDASTVAFIHYEHERYQVARIPFDLDVARDLGTPADFISRDPERVRAVDGGELRRSGSVSQVPGRAADNEVPGTAEVPDTTEHHVYRPILHLRPRVAYPFLLYQRPTDDEKDVFLGFGGGLGLEWADLLQYWSAHTHLFYQRGGLWGRALVRSGRYLLRPSAEVFRHPSTVIIRRQLEGKVDTVRVGRDEWGIGSAIRLPAVLESNVYQTTAVPVLGIEYRSERLFGREGETIREAIRRVTLRPILTLQYRMQANPRDIIPSSGLAATVNSAVDVWSERGTPSRWFRADGAVHLPFFRPTSTGLKVSASILGQNQGGLLDLTTFFPRGYETETVFLGAGAYGKVGLEVVQPLWYVDDGLTIIPIYVKAVFAYGFAEAMDGLTERLDPRRVAGAGVGIQLRFFHAADVTLRLAPVYRFDASDWNVTFR